MRPMLIFEYPVTYNFFCYFNEVETHHDYVQCGKPVAKLTGCWKEAVIDPLVIHNVLTSYTPSHQLCLSSKHLLLTLSYTT